MKVSKQTLRLQRRIQDLNLIPPDARVLVGVSGGADSMALLHLLSGLALPNRWHMEVAHLHHGLRGSAADADARLVADHAAQLQIACHIGHARVGPRARSSTQSVEMLAREARHRFFRRLVRQQKMDCVALAHTLDDQAETVLLRVFRGTGLHGLGGMSHTTQLPGLPLIRPLLTTSKAELVEWLQAQQLDWREDESNRSMAHQRNRVRTQVLPLLKQEFNPEIVAALNRMAAGLRLDRELVDEVAASDVKTVLTGAVILLSEWDKLSPARRRRVLFHWLQRQGIEPDYQLLLKVEKLCGARSGTLRLPLSAERSLIRAYDQLMMQTGPGPSRLPLRFRLPHAGQRCQQEWRVAVEAAVGFRKPRQQTVGQWPAVGYLSASRIGRSALYLRTIRPGDRFTPMGMQGSRKVQDILTDLKVPRHQRAGTVVVECRNELVWLPGYGISRDWAVANRKAASLRIRIQRAKGA